MPVDPAPPGLRRRTAHGKKRLEFDGDCAEVRKKPTSLQRREETKSLLSWRGGVECRNAQRRIRLDVKALKAAAHLCLTALGREGETVSILLVDDKAMRALHQRWMGSPVTTDVLSFAHSGAFSHSRILGDVAISVETAARRNPRRLPHEVDRYLIHGILHLVGFDHRLRRERDRMRQEERHLERIVQRVRCKA